MCILFILDTNIDCEILFSRTVLDFDLRQFGELYLIKFHNVFTVLAWWCRNKAKYIAKIKSSNGNILESTKCQYPMNTKI